MLLFCGLIFLKCVKLENKTITVKRMMLMKIKSSSS